MSQPPSQAASSATRPPGESVSTEAANNSVDQVTETVIQETVIQETVIQVEQEGAGSGVAEGSQAVQAEGIGEDVTMGGEGPADVDAFVAAASAAGPSVTVPSAPADTHLNGHTDIPASTTSDIFRSAGPSAQPLTINPADLFPRHSSPAGEASSSRPSSVGPNHQISTLSRTHTASSPMPPVRPRTYRTGYIYDMLMMLHCVDGYQPTDEHIQDSGDGHPEEPMRIKRIFSRLKEAGLIGRMKKLAFQQVSFEQVMLVHSEDHWSKVEGTQEMTDEIIQQTKHFYEQLSLYVCRETAHCARLSCGGVIQACISVCTGEVRNAFAIVRPPGHHAEPDEHMGFCFYNNVAVAAKEVQRLGMAKKVLILDWDVHHGNGTQRAFWEDPDVLYISIHRHDGGKFYPTSDFGALDMVGSGAGEGKSVNIPWPGPGHGDADYLYAFQKIVMPIAYEFAPDLVIISAGFDAAEGDTLGQCNVTPPAYGHMTHMLCAVAGGRVVVALEGGYNLKAISDSSVAVAQVLLGETPAELPPLQASEIATEVMYQASKVQSKYWKSIDVKSCEPPEITEVGDIQTRTSIPDLLKAHRAHHMFTKHGLYQIPLASEELQAMFDGQVICSPTVYEAGEKSVLVVFVHDFGNLRVETDGVATTNVHMTNSYLLDTSDLIVDWVNTSGYGLIDVNILMALPDSPSRSGKTIVQRAPAEQAKLMRYLWDNYIELSECENVVLIGHGSGCQAIVDLVNCRDVEHKVKAVVQVAGLHSLVRIDPKNEQKGMWFRSSSKIYVPQSHPLLEDDRARRKVGGQIVTADESTKVVDVLNEVLPQIKEFVGSKAEAPPARSTAADVVNGDAGEAVGMGAAEVAQEVNGDGDVSMQEEAGLQLNGEGSDASAIENGENVEPIQREPSPPPPIAI